MCDWTALRQQLLPVSEPLRLPPQIKVPALPVALTRFAERADDPEASIAELARILESDSGLSFLLLLHVNSSAFGMRKLASVHQALAVMGARAAKLFLLSSAARMFLKPAESRLINVPNFAVTNLERALFAREVARHLRADADLAFSAALLQDVLLPQLTHELFEDYLAFLDRNASAVSLPEFETAQFGWVHALAAATFMHEWNFPDDMVVCVLLHHRGAELLHDPVLGRTAAATVALSALLPDPMRQSPRGLERLEAAAVDLPGLDLRAVAERVGAQMEQLSPRAGGLSMLRPLREMVAVGR